MTTTTRMNDHTHTYEGTWKEHKKEWGEWGRIIGTAHAYHDLFHEMTEMDIDTMNHIIHAYIGGTLAWEADMPNPIEAWQETYGEQMPEGYVRQCAVRAWARAYYKAYEDEVYRLVCEQRDKHYRQNPVKWIHCH